MSNDQSIEFGLRQELGVSVDDDNILKACVDMCRVFNLSPEELRYKWEAMNFSSSLRSSSILDIEGAKALRQQIKRELDNRVEAAARVKSMRGVTASHSGKLFAGPAIHSSNRKDDLMIKAQKEIAPPMIYKTVFKRPEPTTRPYRYMFEKTMERSYSLDSRIDKFAELVRNYHGIEQLGDPSIFTEAEVVIVGRVVADSDAKLNEASLMIESSRMLGGGRRTPLKFATNFLGQNSTTGVSLFPGMILAARGKNGGGGKFIISEILESPPHKHVEEEVRRVIEPFSAVISSGPFTPEAEADLHFKPLHALLKKSSENPPSVLILLGPFLDAGHPSLRSGSILEDPSTIFARSISKPLHAFMQQCPTTRVVLVSSVKDILNTHYVFPQAALAPDALGLPPSVILLPNPSSFSINGVQFGISTVDILFHMKREEFTKNSSLPPSKPETRDPMRDLCRQVVEQRSFYPLFPVPREFVQDVNLDVSHVELLDFEYFSEDLATIPDILVLPSVLRHFNKLIGRAMVINPPSMSKMLMYTYLTCRPVASRPLEEFISVQFETIDMGSAAG